MLARNRSWPVTIAKGRETRDRRTSFSHDIIRGESADYELAVIMRNFFVVHNKVGGRFTADEV